MRVRVLLVSARPYHDPVAFKTRAIPTFEQCCIVDAFETGEAVTIRALAGTGKTTVLKMCAHSQPNRTGAYLAFNRAIADDARGGFPQTVDARTAHSFAFAAIGQEYAERLNSPRKPLYEIAEILKIRGGLSLQGRMLNPSTCARIVADTVTLFCYSADEMITKRHVPVTKGIDTPEQKTRLAEMIVPLARSYWYDLQQVEGQFKFTHDHYLKMWGLSKPHLPFDYLLFDEAQDANPVIADIVANQNHMQRIAVGDSNQAIYGWRGAIDAMDEFNAEFNLTLTQSFRFGIEIADAANFWLAQLKQTLRVKGTESIDDDVTKVPWPKALLCRTNAGALGSVMGCLDQNIPVALVGGASEVVRFCKAADQLKAGKRTTHEELCAFRNWLEVQEYIEDEDIPSDLGRLVKLVEQYGTEKIIAALEKTVPEYRAQVIISTGHKAKGREWDSVRLHADFIREMGGDEDNPRDVPDAEIKLRYVATTRAKQLLDLGPLMRLYRPDPVELVATTS